MGVEETLTCPLGSPEWSTEGKGNYYFFYEKACDKGRHRGRGDTGTGSVSFL